MTVKNATLTTISQDGSVIMLNWTLSAGDETAPVEMLEFGDRCIQCVGGTWGGGTIVWEGSNDGAVFGTLKDAQTNDLSFTVDGRPKQIIELPRYSKARVSVAGTLAGVIVYLVLRRSNPMRT